MMQYVYWLLTSDPSPVQCTLFVLFLNYLLGNNEVVETAAQVFAHGPKEVDATTPINTITQQNISIGLECGSAIEFVLLDEVVKEEEEKKLEVSVGALPGKQIKLFLT
jgi:hypothetical protein